ncbi:hypothetical protein [uncultured Rubinisphaera sp.]|uniref:hypothetical protein n=1 Tax=uncultured Rubinisphaera sp. TaxID=1678686 RepID=UPI0030DAF7B3
MKTTQYFHCPVSMSVALLVATTVLMLDTTPAFSQKSGSSSKSNRNNAANVTILDQQAEQAHKAFLETSADLAREYEDLGELEKAKGILEQMLKLAPDLKQVKDKIDSLEEARIAGNEAILEVDASQSWMPANVAVVKGNTIRFESNGEFRMLVNQTVGPDGVASKDVKTDLATGVPLGALMGLIVDAKGKSSDPFSIGKTGEMKAPQDGQLFVRVNVPPQSKCIGKIKLRITGDIVVPKSETSSRR